MARVKRGPRTRRRHKRLYKAAEGFSGRRKNCYRIAKPAVDHSLAYAFAGRKQRKRDLRRLWITRINAAARKLGLSYSRLIPLLERAQIEIDRKVLAGLAAKDFPAFEKIVSAAKAAG